MGTKIKTDPRAKKPTENFLQWRSRLADMDQNERDRSEPIVPQAALKNGDYRKRFVTHVETNTKAETMVSRHDPVKRWEDADKLTKNQLVVIEMVQRLWRLAGLQQRVTATYGERLPHGSSYELRALTEIEAREDLHRIQGYFPGPLMAYFNVFEAVCRHGIAAGVAGAQLSTTMRSAEVRAHQVVCMVADVIATREGL